VSSSQLVSERFELKHQIGAGGMGRLFLAVDQSTGAEVALKQLTLRGEEAVARFEREAVTLRSIAHPHVVRYIAHGQHGPEWYLVMELVHGEPLSSRIQREGLTLDEAMVVGRQLASALSALHDEGLVHRDIKPPNVMVPLGHIEPVKLVDFGLARQSEGPSSLTKTGTAVGSPGYMSPEQARGERHLTPAVDLYALGCVLYVSVTGQPPFPGQNTLAVHTKILAFQPLPPHVHNPECPLALSNLIMSMLAQDKRLRPRSAQEVQAALEAIGSVGAATKMKLKARAPVARFLAPSASTLEVLVRAQSFTVVLRPLDEEDEEVDTLEHPPVLVETLEALAARHEANLGILKDGTCAFISRPDSGPMDRAHAACLLALDLQRRLLGWVVALALGGTRADDTVDRALQLLAAEQMNAYLAGTGAGVRIDDETLRRLGPLGSCAERQGRQYLLALAE
jgi:serine/threonine protein kinase